MKLGNREMENSEMNILTDEELVRMAHEGSSTAEEFLIRKYKKLAKSKAQTYFIAGGDNDDVIQEGMIGLFEAIRDYDEESEAAFRTFAELCVNRQVISAIQRANRKKHQILNDSLSLNDDEKSDNNSAETLLDRVPAGENVDPESLTLMNEVVTYLQADGVDIFSQLENQVWSELRKGLDYKEIAAALGRDPKSIDNAIQRIKKKIYEFLEY